MSVRQPFSRASLVTAITAWPRLTLITTLLVAVVGGPPVMDSHPALAASPAQTGAAASGGLPLSFIPNRGQTDPQVVFQASSAGGALFFTADEIVIATTRSSPNTPPLAARELEPTAAPQKDVAISVTRLQFVGANRRAAIVGVDPLPGIANFFLGNDPAKWQTNLPTFAGIVYRDLYPGIDLRYDGNSGGQIKGTYLVAPGADPSAIRWRYAGAPELAVDAATGDLHISAAAVTLTELAPISWQEIRGQRVPVATRYVLNTDGTISFALPQGYDRTQPLTLDPTLIYSTYLGGFAEDNADAVGIDASGNMYMSGLTFSTTFPTQNPIQGSNAGGADVYVTKLNAAGSALIYSTYLGGTGLTDYGLGMAVDDAGNAYVTGITDSGDFPTAGTPYQNTLGGGNDVFLAKLNPTGTALLYSTYLGGAGFDFGFDIAAAPTGGVAYVAGRADSGFPIAGTPYQSTFGGGASDAFVARFSTTLTGTASLPYSTFVGGTGEDRATGLAIDAATSAAYLTGRTASTDFPLAGTPFQNQNGGGAFDAFVLRLNTAVTGTAALAYSTFLGGSGDDRGLSIARDSAGQVYVSGRTLSTNFPTSTGAFDTTCGSDGNCDFDGTQNFFDAFVARFDPAASGAASRLYSTYLGGNRRDQGLGIAVHPTSGEAYLTGYTNSTNFPTQNAFQYTCGWGCGQVFSDPLTEGFTDAFITRINPAGTGLVYSSYLGGSSADFGFGILLDSAANVLYIAGESYSTDYPLLNPYQSFNSGGYDVTLSRFDNAATTSANLSVTKSDAPDPVFAGSTLTYTLAVNNAGPNTATGVRLVDALPENGAVFFNTATSSQGSCFWANAIACNLGDMASGATSQVTITVNVNPLATGTALTNTASVASNVADPNGANNSATAITTLNRSADLIVTKSDSPDPVATGQALTYTIDLTNTGPSGALGVVVTDTLPAGATFSSVENFFGTCTGASVVVCTFGDLYPGSSAFVTLVVTPTVGGTLANTVTARSDTFDPNLTNNTDTENTSVTGGPTPTRTSTTTPTATRTPTPTLASTNTPTATPTNTPTGTATSTPTITPTPSPTNTATGTPPTATPTQTRTPTATMTLPIPVLYLPLIMKAP